jgi:hypothetical protein
VVTSLPFLALENFKLLIFVAHGVNSKLLNLLVFSDNVISILNSDAM